ncbi:MAG: ribonuclease R [Bacteroidetes bacterium CG12_big_fil_rev_8_21_14_0_65_60_17]|nr:MAG: ribonuclease R [Bacteroidetes bacterium CG12_big_fil_rev_8_21_14_0_65_60_17]
MSSSRIEDRVLSFFKNHGKRTFRAKEVAKRLDLKDRKEYEAAVEALQSLEKKGYIQAVGGNRFSYRPPENHMEGRLSVHPDGFGFVSVDGWDDDFYVRSRRMGTALDGDRVKVATVAAKKGDQRREVEVVEVVVRSRQSAVGTFEHSGSFATVTPDDRRLTHDIFVDLDTVGQAKDGDKVVVSIDAFNKPGSAPRGRLLSVIGRADDPAVQTLSVALSVGAIDGFSPEAEKEAARAEVQIDKATLKAREDFRQRRVFTIDPVDAKDFDDALHVHALGNGNFEVGVHIADVSHYVPEGSALDRDAVEKGTSVYLVDRVMPMLPEHLSNNVCSLRPNEDRLAFSCIFELDPEGRVVRFRAAEAIIRSQQRFAYEDAQRLIDGAEHELAEDVRLLARLARSMRKTRFEKGSVNFDLPEIRVVLDEKGHPVDIVLRERHEANQLIEEYMLLANRSIAEEFGDEKFGGFIFRVHDVPNAERIARLASYMKAFGLRVEHADGAITPQALNSLLESVKGSPQEAVIEQAALRAMSRAVYSVDNIGHYGLALSAYTHFTSPIRRYPDLIVHRIVKAHLSGEGRPSPATLDELATHCTEREQIATQAERESVKLKQVEYARMHVGDEVDGVISGLTRFGIFIELPKLLIEGLIHVRDMDGDFYEYIEEEYVLRGRKSGRTYKLGQEIRVKIASASMENREIDFVFA